jgi:diguanylate cyclase (GGDEF)-like protein/PAS domain S-box-containing protein
MTGSRTRPARAVLTGYLVGVGAPVAYAVAVPEARGGLTPLVALLGVLALVVGIRRNRPRRAYSWWLLAGGLLALAVGDLVHLTLTDRVGGDAHALPELCYLAMIPFIGAGILGLTRASVAAPDRSRMLDLLLLGTAVGFVLWLLIIHPHVATVGQSDFGTTVTAVYPLASAVLAVAMGRLMTTNRYQPASVLLCAGAVGALGTNVGYGLVELYGGGQPTSALELGFLLLPVAWGAAALHPSMRTLTEPVEPEPVELSVPRLVSLTGLALLGPAVLLIEVVTGRIQDLAVIAVVSGISLVLLVTRLADGAEAHRSAVHRERGLRAAAADLLAAADAADVERVVTRAVARLLPAGAAHRILFVIHRSTGASRAASSIWGTTLATASGSDYPASAATARRSRVLRVHTLHPALVGQFDGFEAVLVCPLIGDERATGAPRVGALLVATSPRILARSRDSLELLAVQVALTLERVNLNREVGRRNSEEYFRALVGNAADVIVVLDEERIRYASPSIATVLGVESADDDELWTVFHPEDRQRVVELLAAIRHRGESGRLAWSARRPDGEPVHLDVSWRDLRRDRAVRGLVLTLRDVTEHRRLAAELSRNLRHDGLTGLVNRTSFLDRTYAVVETARQRNRTVGVLSLDLDEFTTVNDGYGPAIGDGLLIEVGRRLQAEAGATGPVARLGGDEFAVLVPDADDPATVERVADRLLAALGEPFVVDGTEVRGSVSIGLATTADNDGGTDAGELLQRAELARYVAKRAGKGRWCRYRPELHTEVVERLALRSALADAVDNLTFSVDYQPIVELRTGRTLGFEALARWRHPERGQVPPAQFIALAEETGLIEPLGDWVLRQAVAAAASWRAVAGGGPAPYVSINVSARQLRTAGFVSKLSRTLATAGTPPAAVMLEITESLLLCDEEPVWAELADLRARGLRVAIDDFGTGYSSLSYLQRMPVDVLKMDRSFFSTVSLSRRQRLLVEGIVRLAEQLGLEIIAEGVETEATRSALVGMGCPTGQGYLFSRPLRAADVAGWLTVEAGAVSVPTPSHAADESGLAVADQG